MYLLFVDIETSGIDHEKERPLEICVKVLNAESLEIIWSFCSCIKWDGGYFKSNEFNEITEDDLIKGKTIREVGDIIISEFRKIKINRGNSLFICQNPSFDKCFFCHIISVTEMQKLNWPYHWLDLGSIYWAVCVMPQLIRGIFEYRSLRKDLIAQHLGIGPEEQPHRAERGVDHLIKCYKRIYEVVGYL